jgi:ADP-heptose:LPS heptosyltransferase/tetratricopeptide (TPR) repeat protein
MERPMFLRKKQPPSAATPDLRLIASDMISRADAARDAGRLGEAALLYGEALRLTPDNAGIHVQCANMLKDTGQHAAAETHYQAALALRPNDADAALQMGHLYKSWGRLDRAQSAYGRALELSPDWAEPRVELERISSAGWRGGVADDASGQADAVAPDFAQAAREIGIAADIEHLAPELMPSPLQALLKPHVEEVAFRALGRRERSLWGVANVLRGIEAIRGICISATPVTEIQLYLNDQLIYRGAPAGGGPVPDERDNPSLRKYAFNIWFDFSGFARGRHELEVRAMDARQRSRNLRHMVVIAAPWAETDFPKSDQLVNTDPADPRGIEEQINTRPSMIRPGKRALLESPPRAILVLRTDQLGDMVVSVPALRVLRDMFPAAQLIGLLSPANAELGATLGLFDHIVIADFPDDRAQRRRIMPIDAQVTLRAQLAAFPIDMAIDLSEVSPSRLLFNLTDAPFRYGFRHPQEPNLTLDIEGNSHDRRDYHEVVPHTNKLVGMMEWLRAMTRSEPNIARRDDLDRASLKPFGIGANDRFVVMHDGARLAFSRWPHYAALAEQVLAETDLKLILLTDDPAMRATLSSELAGSDRFHLVDGRLQFDEFDALVSFCSLFIGNDSGPKHLASLRGAPVVSLHMARSNWNEWGQENGGYILSRKLPCAGCLISQNPEECAKDFVCIRAIKPEEVMQAVRKLL